VQEISGCSLNYNTSDNQLITPGAYEDILRPGTRIEYLGLNKKYFLPFYDDHRTRTMLYSQVLGQPHAQELPTMYKVYTRLTQQHTTTE